MRRIKKKKKKKKKKTFLKLKKFGPSTINITLTVSWSMLVRLRSRGVSIIMVQTIYMQPNKRPFTNTDTKTWGS